MYSLMPSCEELSHDRLAAQLVWAHRDKKIVKNHLVWAVKMIWTKQPLVETTLIWTVHAEQAKSQARKGTLGNTGSCKPTVDSRAWKHKPGPPNYSDRITFYALFRTRCAWSQARKGTQGNTGELQAYWGWKSLGTPPHQRRSPIYLIYSFEMQSTLKVAACNPGQVPYVSVLENGTLQGYDLGKEFV